MRALVAAGVLVLVTGWPASAVDADRRLGDERPPEPERPGVLLLSDLKPDVHCLRVRIVPVSTGRDLLYRACHDDVVLPAPRPWGHGPPVVIPVLPQR